MRVLVVNVGSSSLKASVVDPHHEATLASVERGPVAAGADGARMFAELVGALGPNASSPDVVAHRVVHGGPAFTSHALVDDDALAAIHDLAAIAPLHNAPAEVMLRASLAAMGDTPHVACFDTAFHATMPFEARIYPLPWSWYADWGIRRYGFHGLSVAWSVRRAGELLHRSADELRLVVAHLGSGCSVTAVDGGRSVETSMGYTPLDGVMMTTRPGALDPGVLLHVLRERGLGVEAVSDVLSHASGLRGIAGGDGGALEIEERAANGDDRAALALNVFARRTAAGIAAAATSLPAVDALVFTGGIGANSDRVRRDVVGRLGALGIPPLPLTSSDEMLTAGPPAVLRVVAREDLAMALEAAALLAGPRPTA
jgi:acetate kinase